MINSVFYVYVLILASLRQNPTRMNGIVCILPANCWTLFVILCALFLDVFVALWFRSCIHSRVFLITQQMYTNIPFSKIVYVMYWTMLGAFAKLRKATISFFMSALPSVRLKQFGCYSKDFHEIWYLIIFRKTLKKIQFFINS